MNRGRDHLDLARALGNLAIVYDDDGDTRDPGMNIPATGRLFCHREGVGEVDPQRGNRSQGALARSITAIETEAL